jgi:predicted DNA-binding transcriptional regulator YafY
LVSYLAFFKQSLHKILCFHRNAIRAEKRHDSQQLKELKDGGLELRMKLSSLAAVEWWVLGWAGNAKVIQPPELAEKVRKSAEDILERK